MEILKVYITDIILSIIFIICVVYYYKKGFVRSVLDFCSFFVSVAATRFLYPIVSEWLLDNTTIFKRLTLPQYKADVFSIVLIFIIVSIVLKVAISLADRIFKLPVLKTANNAMGIVFGVGCGFLILTGAVVVCKVLQLTGYEPLAEAINNSVILDIDTKILGVIFPAFKDLVA